MNEGKGTVALAAATAVVMFVAATLTIAGAMLTAVVSGALNDGASLIARGGVSHMWCSGTGRPRPG